MKMKESGRQVVNAGLSAEAQLQREFAKTYDYRIYQGQLYVWDRDHWEQWTGDGINRLENEIFRRVNVRMPEKLTSRLIKSCMNTIMASRLDDTRSIQDTEEKRMMAESLIVPTKGKWIRLVPADHGDIQYRLELVMPDPSYFITYNVNVNLSERPLGEYLPDLRIEGTLLAQYVNTTFRERDYIKLFQDFAGYSLLKRNFAKKALCFIGEGDSGKSTALRLLELLHEPSKVHSMTLSQGDNFALAHLRNASLITIAESENGENQSVISEGIFKQITGGDKLLVNVKYSNAVSMKINAPIVLATNKKFSVSDKSGAMHNRLMYLPVSKPDKVIPEIEKQIERKELPKYLDFALVGLLRVVNRPTGKEFYLPQSLRDIINEDRIENSAIRNFIQEEGLCVITDNHRHYSMELWNTINAWFMQNNPGMRAMKNATIKSEISAILKENGYAFQERQEKVNGNSGKKVCNVAPAGKCPGSWQVVPLSPTRYSKQRDGGQLQEEEDATEQLVDDYLIERKLRPSIKEDTFLVAV